MKWRTFQDISVGISKLDLTLVIFISSTKVNFHFKNGSAILGSSNINIRSKNNKTVRNINESVYFETTNRVNTITEKDLYSIHGYYKYSHKKNIIKHGNLGKDKLLNVIANIIKLGIFVLHLSFSGKEGTKFSEDGYTSSTPSGLGRMPTVPARAPLSLIITELGPTLNLYTVIYLYLCR